MTAAAVRRRLPPARRRTTRAAGPLPPLSPRLQLARSALVVVFVVSAGLLLEVVLLGSLRQRAAQQRAFDNFRGDLAEGTGPVGPVGANGRELSAGAPVAYLEIPSIGLRQVVGEGTTAATLFNGPGHRRDTPLPGQGGVSVVFGRKAAFGGPFARVHRLRRGALIRVTTGQGAFDYRVTGLRRDGDVAPPPPDAGSGRLLLATADGRPFIPAGVLRVDADLALPAVPAPARLIGAHSLPAAEQMMGADTRTLWALALWLQALILVVLGAVWAWHRRGPARAWVVFLPPLLLTALSTSGEAARLLPNLL